LAEVQDINLFKPVFLRADLVGSVKPQQDLLVSLKADNSGDLSQHILLLKLRTGEDIEQVAEAYQNSPIVQTAEPNFDLKIDPAAEPATEASTELEAPASIPAETTIQESQPVLVAVLDSGVDITHPDLVGRTEPGWNFVNQNNDVADSDGHGTHTAGIILRNSAAARILPLKISDGATGKMSELVAAIKFAADNSVQVINLSLGLPQESEILHEAIDYARAKNVLIVAAAGNYNTGTKFFPAAWPEVFGVAALGKNGSKLFLSNFGEWVDCSVMAQDVYAPAPGGKYAYRTGTSEAAPVVSAKIADLLSTATEPLDFSEVNDFLLQNSEPITSKYALGRRILAAGEQATIESLSR
jgi:thermitase